MLTRLSVGLGAFAGFVGAGGDGGVETASCASTYVIAVAVRIVTPTFRLPIPCGGLKAHAVSKILST